MKNEIQLVQHDDGDDKYSVAGKWYMVKKKVTKDRNKTHKKLISMFSRNQIKTNEDKKMQVTARIKHISNFLFIF